MNVLIDIGHPAHVHYFKHSIHLLRKEGHEFRVVARDNDVIHELLDRYDIPYISRGPGGSSIPGKMLYIARADYILLQETRRFRPDLMLSVASPYLAQVAWLTGTPSITFDDTEGAILGRMLYLPFTGMVITPYTYKNDLGSKQVLVNSSLEMFYLHRSLFRKHDDMRRELGLAEDEPYAIFRLVSWKAVHDRGHRGLGSSDIHRIIEELSRHCRVFISSESDIPDSLESMRFLLPAERMHDALAGATLYVGEGATMAAEASMMGVPACYVSSIELGYIRDHTESGLIHHYHDARSFLRDLPDIVRKALETGHEKRTESVFRNRVNMTAMLCWLIRNWPESREHLRQIRQVHTDKDLETVNSGTVPE